MNKTSTPGSTANESSIVVEKLGNGLNGVGESQTILGNQKHEEGKKMAFDWNTIPWKSLITLIMFICVFIVIYPRLDSVFSMIHQLVGLPAAFINLLEDLLKTLGKATDPTDPHFWGSLILSLVIVLASPLLALGGVIAKAVGNKSDPEMEKVYETTGITEDEFNKERIEKIKEKLEEFKTKENREPTKNEKDIMVESVQIEQYQRVLERIDDGKPSAENAKEVVNKKITDSIKKKSDAEALEEKERKEREKREREKELERER
jgi:hypothetical protein